MRLVAFFLITGGLLAASAANLKPDQHLDDRAGVLYQRSAFAHGYLHGYEDGFHEADQDLHMGHLLPGVTVHRERRDTQSSYRLEFGDRNLFMKGYREGLRAGYDDGVAGREFRAIDDLRAAADGLDPNRNAMHFDRGFADGYAGGRQQTATQNVTSIDFSYVGSWCREQLKHNESSDQYCDAYTRGYRLGYSERARQPERAQTARAR